MKNDLKMLSNDSLVSKTKVLVREELRISLEVLEHLREIESRKLFLSRGHPSLFSFCTKELGYSEPQAELRISAMRAIRDTPEIAEKITSGKLNVSVAAKVQRFIKKEQVRAKQFETVASRLELFDRLEGKSFRDVERELVKISPESGLQQEKERIISHELVELKLVISESLRAQLENLRALYSHKMKDSSSTAELIRILAEEALVREHKRRGIEVAAETSSSLNPDQNVAPITLRVGSRYIPTKIRREVWKRDQGACTYIDPKTGQTCGSKFYLQIDHAIPFARGGSSTDTRNLRLYCGLHNRHAWEKFEAG